MIDATNTLIIEAQVVLKNIVGLDVFVNKEQWNTIRMKEEYHTKFVAILQIIYQQKKLTYFNKHIAITFNLANKGKKVNWCSIMLTQMVIELTQWATHHKSITTWSKNDYLLFGTNHRGLYVTLVSIIWRRGTCWVFEAISSLR